MSDSVNKYMEKYKDMDMIVSTECLRDITFQLDTGNFTFKKGKFYSYSTKENYILTPGGQRISLNGIVGIESYFDITGEKSKSKNPTDLYSEIFQAFRKHQDEQFELFQKKMISYGKGNIAMGGDLNNEEDKRFALLATYIRMNDKMQRLKQLLVKNVDNPLEDEPIEDAWKDLANYAIISQMVFNGEWK